MKVSRKRMMGRRNRLEELPDGILASIVSLLPLVDAVRTSLISKRWRFIWTSYSDLCFDSDSVFPSRAHQFRYPREFGSERQLQRRMFVNTVDKIMQQRSMGGKINSLAISYHLGKKFSSSIHHWINCALSKGVESIDLRLSEGSSFTNSHIIPPNSFVEYEFHSSLLLGENRNLKELRLDSCTLGTPLSHNSLRSLIRIDLESVRINDGLLVDLLSNCLQLKELSLRFCHDLVNLKFTNPSHQLEFLKIENCVWLNVIEISSDNLTRLEYTGYPVNFTIKQAQKLAEVYLNFTNSDRIDGVTYALTELASKLTHTEKLNISSIWPINALKLPDDGPAAFPNVKELILTVHPFDEEGKLGWFAQILRAFPLLQKLQLNFLPDTLISPPMEIERIQQHCCRHEHLTEIEVNGFNGNLNQVELLMYLLKNVTSLTRLLVGTDQKIYGGLDRCVYYYQEAKSSYKSSMNHAALYDWLRQVTPKTIHIKVRSSTVL